MADGGNRTIKGEQFRTFRVERAGQRYSAALSSETPVERWFGTEILSHTQEAVNLERCSDGLQLLFNHDIDRPIGRVQDVRLDGDKLRGELMFGKRADAQEIKQDVDDGMLKDISIRYSIDDFEERTDPHGNTSYLVTRWTVLEASVVTVPADHTVGIGRSRTPGEQPKERRMDDEKDTGGAGNETAGSPTVTQLSGRRKADEERGAAKARKAEAERVETLLDFFDTIDARFHGPDFDALQRDCLRDIKCDLNKARGLVLDFIQGNTPEQTPSTRKVADDQGTRGRDPFVQAGADAGDKLTTAISRSIEERAGFLTPEQVKENQGNELRGRRLSDLARLWASRNGIRVEGMNDYRMLGEVLRLGGRRDIGSGTEDFTGILASVSSKQLLRGWDNAGTTYQQWCRIGSLSDFKRANRTALSGMNLLDAIPENGEYKYGKPADRTEYITAVKYGKLFSISREALLNDDLGAFTQVPMKQGTAAALTINKAVYDSLGLASGTGPTLNQTARALFNATDANYDATSGGITVANVETGRAKMAKQADPTNALPLNIRPKYLLVPTDLESTARVFVASEKDPAGLSGATGGATVPNPFYGQLTVISDAYLSNLTNGTTAWYLIADQNMHDTYEVGFVNGQQTPYLESKNGWDVDGVEYKVRIEAGIAALDFRGMYRKKGA